MTKKFKNFNFLKKIFILNCKFLLRILFFYIFEIWVLNKELELRCNPSYIFNLFLILKKHSYFQYKSLIDIVVYDKPGKTNRFTIVYILLSPFFNSRLLVRSQVNDLENLKSIVSIFSNANWIERELWDMFGIFFSNHPDLRRILTDYGFTGYPLRKDFPLSGLIESYFSEFDSCITYRPVELIQEYRNFSFYN